MTHGVPGDFLVVTACSMGVEVAAGYGSLNNGVVFTH